MDVTAGAPSGELRERALAYATLVRLPNVFTAPPDVLAGAALAAATGGAVGAWDVASLAVASALVYAAGTTLNDYFDADVDAVERPERPIPSGRVSPAEALALGAALLALGVALAALGAGALGLVVAAVLAGAVLAYDAALKDTPLGFVAMGTTRGVNVVLGATAGLASADPIPWLAVVAVAVVAYVAAVTWMAADEAHGTDRSAVLAVAAVAALVAPLPPVLVATTGADPWNALVAAALALAFFVVVGRTLVPVYRDPTPGNVGPAVGVCVLALTPFQAAVAAVAGVAWAATALAFAVPAVVLSRMVDVS